MAKTRIITSFSVIRSKTQELGSTELVDNDNTLVSRHPSEVAVSAILLISSISVVLDTLNDTTSCKAVPKVSDAHTLTKTVKKLEDASERDD